MKWAENWLTIPLQYCYQDIYNFTNLKVPFLDESRDSQM